ncbi:hypothetical protein COU20_03555 [Candidatus Kaiserbacteria bacterium CG10_big_fil_rev_8_21_14_0_10_59_10]|uniref:MFS transporter n=1 Tax=Candidatus Kaiserbacteria bacterium CG10_big_fil_rev_8_21_14_0_10_59_10 TaxID=1974612 RepID=A0A2H0U707_9BACT|nr:MAG: hypothetical protein COU20_03555 [Candidatus Kaiserbacteria bacterium CG10_big_fil_rev_8_21_14_0_10_59_10]
MHSSLYTHRTLVRAAFALAHVFVWVLSFELLSAALASVGAALAATALLHATSQTVSLYTTPFAARFLHRAGARRSMSLAALAAVAAFAMFAHIFSEREGALPLAALCSAVVLLGLYRALYWVPYRVMDDRTAEQAYRSHYLRELGIASLPLAGALILIYSPLGAAALFLCAGLLLLGSMIFLARAPTAYERYDWTFAESMRRLFSASERPLLSSSFLQGVQGAALLFAWPLAVFTVVDGSFLVLGAVMSLSLGATILLRAHISRAVRDTPLGDSIHVSAALGASGWLLRLTAASPIALIIVDTYSNAGNPLRRIGVDCAAFEQAADLGHFVDEFSALKDMGQMLGRITLALILALAAVYLGAFISLALAILIAACAAGVSLYAFQPGRIHA